MNAVHLLHYVECAALPDSDDYMFFPNKVKLRYSIKIALSAELHPGAWLFLLTDTVNEAVGQDAMEVVRAR